MANYDNAESISISSIVAETVIGVETKFIGNVSTDKPIRIDGYFEGEIDSTDLVLVSETGTFNGNVKCRELHLLGRGEGSAVCEDLLQITPGGSFIGNVEAANLITQKGSTLDGTCKILPSK